MQLTKEIATDLVVRRNPARYRLPRLQRVLTALTLSSNVRDVFSRFALALVSASLSPVTIEWISLGWLLCFAQVRQYTFESAEAFLCICVGHRRGDNHIFASLPLRRRSHLMHRR